jgi:hypothetical protein
MLHYCLEDPAPPPRIPRNRPLTHMTRKDMHMRTASGGGTKSSQES